MCVHQCVSVFAFLPFANTQKGTCLSLIYTPFFSTLIHSLSHTHAWIDGGWTFWLMTVICQAEVDKTVNIIFVLRARAHHSLPLLSFISGWTQRHAGTRRRPGSQQIYSHYFSIRTSASTDQVLHLYTDIRKWERGGWREKRRREWEWQRSEIKGRKKGDS